MKRKKVFLYAYDETNVGDDLFIHMITSRYPKVQFFMDCKSDSSVWYFDQINNLFPYYQNKGIHNILNKIRPSFAARYRNYFENKCDAAVYIGGSIFIEYDNWELITSWWDYQAKNRKFYVIGANFGPYKTEEYKQEMNNIFSNMQDVCFRDSFSKELFSECKTIRCAPDIIFSYDITKCSNKKKQVVFSVINCKLKDEGKNQLGAYHNDYMNYMERLAKEFLHDGYQVIFTSFCKKEGDELVVNELENRLKDYYNQIEKIYYDGGNLDYLINVIAESEFVVASRFHAMILGLIAKSKVLPLIYSDKTIQTLKDISYHGLYIDIRKNSNIYMAEYEKVKSITNEIDLSRIKKEAEKHFCRLDQLLK